MEKNITEQDRLLLIEKCIDNLIEIGEFPEADYHEIVDSCNSFVSKLRRLHSTIEEKIMN